MPYDKWKFAQITYENKHDYTTNYIIDNTWYIDPWTNQELYIIWVGRINV